MSFQYHKKNNKLIISNNIDILINIRINNYLSINIIYLKINNPKKLMIISTSISNI